MEDTVLGNQVLIIKDWCRRDDFDGTEEPKKERKRWPKILNFQLKAKMEK